MTNHSIRIRGSRTCDRAFDRLYTGPNASILTKGRRDIDSLDKTEMARREQTQGRCRNIGCVKKIAPNERLLWCVDVLSIVLTGKDQLNQTRSVSRGKL